MNIFKKRPASLILCIALGVFSLSIELRFITKILISLLLILTFSVLCIFKNKMLYLSSIVKWIILSASITLFCSAIWTLLFFPTQFYGQETCIEAKIYNIDKTNSYTDVIYVKTESIDGNRDTHKLIVYIDKEYTVKLKKYDIISFSATISEFSENENGFNTKSYYVSNGYSGVAEHTKDSVEILGNKTDRLDECFSKIRLKISNNLKKSTNYETGALLTALIIGDRSDLDGNTKLNFLRTGISHILALSGMHIALLSISLNKLLSLFSIGKKRRVVAVSLFALFYICLTGFSTSVARAGIMLIITGILYLAQYKPDSITSLFLSVLIILLFTPYAVYDMSLWLSAFATLGVICYSELRKQNDENTSTGYKRKLKSLKDASLISIFAIGATFCICINTFNNMSVLSVITTMLFSFPISILIYSGLLILIIGKFIPFGNLIILLSDVIKEFAELISSIDLAYVSMNSAITKALIIIFCILFFGFIIIETEHKKLFVTLICVTLNAVFVSGLIDTGISKYTDDMVYIPNESSDSYLMKSDGIVTLIHTGEMKKSSARDLSNLLTEQKVVYIDHLIITNYEYTTIDFVETLVSNIKVKKVHVPTPSTKDEINQVEGISELLSLYGTNMRVYDLSETLQFGEFKYRIYYKNDYSYGDSPMTLFTIQSTSKQITYVSYGDYSTLNADARMILYNTEHLFIGSTSKENISAFPYLLPKISSMHVSNSDVVPEYYHNKEVPICNIETPTSIYSN